MNLKLIVMSKRSQMKNSPYQMFHFVGNSRKCKQSIVTESRSVVSESGMWEERCFTKEHKKLLGVLHVFIIRIVLWIYAYVKYIKLYTEYVQFTLC